MLDLATLALLAAASLGLGGWLLDRLGDAPASPLERAALALPLGLGGLGLALLALGLLGEMAVGGVVALCVAYAAAGVMALGHQLRNRRHAPRSATTAPASAPLGWPDAVLAGLLALNLVGTLLTALAPVTDGDALCYHLLVARRILERGGMFFDPDLHETVYPLLVELLYAAGLAVRGPVACRLIQWLFGLTLGLNVAALARPYLGRRAWWAGAIVLLVPAVSNGMTAPLNDVALAAFGTSALLAWVRYREHPAPRRAAVLGVMLGLAIGVKYPALVLVGLLVATMLPRLVPRLAVRLARWGISGPFSLMRSTRSARRRLVDRLTAPEPDAPAPRTPRRRFAHAALAVAVLLAIGGTWYARAAWHTGNPVHPFFRHVFGGAGLDEVLGAEKRPLGVNPWRLLTALGPLTLQPDRFDSFSHQFGPLFLLFLPALLLERPPRRLLTLVFVGYVFLTLCLTQRQSMRFVLTALGPLAVGVAWLGQTWWQRRTRPTRGLVAALLLAAAFEAGLGVVRARHGLSVVLGRETTEAYLARTEPTFTVGRWVDAHLPADARLIGQDHRGFYIPRPYTMELAHRRRTGLGRDDRGPLALVETLRSEGFTHLLICPPEPETAVEFDGTLTRRLASWLARQEPLYEADLRDGDGVTRHYAVYELADRPAWLTGPVPPPPVDPAVTRAGDEEASR